LCDIVERGGPVTGYRSLLEPPEAGEYDRCSRYME
jgi:hypothetical protein